MAYCIGTRRSRTVETPPLGTSSGSKDLRCKERMHDASLNHHHMPLSVHAGLAFSSTPYRKVGLCAIAVWLVPVQEGLCAGLGDELQQVA